MSKWHEEICKLAYELYEKRGRGDGSHLDDWLEAERIVRARNVKETEKGRKPSGAVRKRRLAPATKEKEVTSQSKEPPKKRVTARKTGARTKTT